MRYDHAWSYYPEQQIGPTRFLPTALVFPETKGVVGYNDINPRFGVAYDLFGTGKTALKFNVGRYLEAAVGGNGNYSALLPSSRLYDQRDPNVDRRQRQLHARLRPEQSALAQDTASGGDFCGADHRSELREADQHAVVRPPDHAGLVRPAERLDHRRDGPARNPPARLARSVGYTRRWLQNFTVTDNRSPERRRTTRRSASRRRSIRGCRAAAATSCLVCTTSCPAEGQPGRQLPHVCTDYGDISQVYNGVDINVAARLRNGLQLQAGTNTGQRVTDYCAVRSQLPEQTGGFSTGSEVPGVQSDQPLLPLRAGDRHAVHDGRHLYDPEGRRDRQRQR